MSVFRLRPATADAIAAGAVEGISCVRTTSVDVGTCISFGLVIARGSVITTSRWVPTAIGTAVTTMGTAGSSSTTPKIVTSSTRFRLKI